MQTQNIAQILKYLLIQKDMKVTDLAREISIPQSTIQRIVSGSTKRPHPSSIQKIAEYFSITIEQLKGKSPIPWLNIAGFLTNNVVINEVPLLSWKETTIWPNENIKSNRTIITDSNVSSEAYALEIKDLSMEPLFTKGTIIIVDPQKKIKDRCYAVVKLNNHEEAIFRQILIEDEDYYLKSLSYNLEEFEILRLGKDDEIKAVLVQAKRYYED